jgi:hypothetical protein
MKVLRNRPLLWLALLGSFTAGTSAPATAQPVRSSATQQEAPGQPEIHLRFIETPVEKQAARPAQSESRPLVMRAGALAAFVDELSGRQVRLLNGRVVGVLEPHAFLIEPATPDLKPMGQRDRLLVLVDSGVLRVSSELLVGATVIVTGVARTLLGLQVSRDAPWPLQLDAQNTERWEVRGAVLATSVQTADGTELTDRVELR